MNEVLTKLVVDCSTGEQSIVPFTPEEITAWQKMHEQYETERLAAEAEAQAKAEAKASAIAKLAALGITEDEAKALFI